MENDSLAKEIVEDNMFDDDFNEKRNRIKSTRNILKLNYQKIDGIEPIWFNKLDILNSFYNG
jgi:hypothetical protein